MDDIPHAHRALVAMQQRDWVSSRYVSLLEHGAVETGEPVLEEELEDVVASELHAKLVARHARRSHDQSRRPHLQVIADMDGVVAEAPDGVVLADHAPGQLHHGLLLAPERIVLGGVDVDGHVGPAVDPQVRLLIYLQIEPSAGHKTSHRLFEDTGQRLST